MAEEDWLQFKPGDLAVIAVDQNGRPGVKFICSDEEHDSQQVLLAVISLLAAPHDHTHPLADILNRLKGS